MAGPLSSKPSGKLGKSGSLSSVGDASTSQSHSSSLRGGTDDTGDDEEDDEEEEIDDEGDTESDNERRVRIDGVRERRGIRR